MDQNQPSGWHEEQTGLKVEPTERVTSLTQQQQTGSERHQIAVLSQAEVPHFLNALRYFPRKLSCAVDCFLEVWFRVLDPLTRSAEGSEFINLLKVVKTEYDNELQVHYTSMTSDRPTAMRSGMFALGFNMCVIREKVWAVLREKCSSFMAMDGSAQFSQIFSKNVFSNVSAEQKSRLMSMHYFEGTCDHCVAPVHAELEVFVNYVTLLDMG